MISSVDENMTAIVKQEKVYLNENEGSVKVSYGTL